MDLTFAIILGLIWSQIISHFGASILLHRYYCHHQFSVPVWFERVGLFMLMVAVIRSPVGWIASHRMHHSFSDGPGDPHAISQVGWFKVLVLVWVISFAISPYFFIGFALVPFIFAKIGFGLLNSVGHMDGPSNVPWLNIFISGEGYHKNHHDDSKRVRLHKYDTGGWLAEKIFKG